MRCAPTIPMLAVAIGGFAAIVLIAPGSAVRPLPLLAAGPDLIELRAGTFSYRESGDFILDGVPAPAPIVTAMIPWPLAVMRHQVTQVDYRYCVDAGACPMIDADTAADRPQVKVSWRDSQAYASWLSRRTGTTFRLPTEEEWVYAAADRFRDAAPAPDAYADPGQRALTRYEQAADRDTMPPQAIGSFGANRNGLLDVAGNVWEWTNTCFARVTRDTRGGQVGAVTDCGLRLATGRHRAYLPDFIRDARSGGCGPGAQPHHLGFRLVRDDGATRWRGL
jgi:formylglycine-generating enzyme required for sulfatase activity